MIKGIDKISFGIDRYNIYLRMAKKISTYRNMRNFYREVNELPPGAMTVREYTDTQGWQSTSYVYHLIKRGKANFEIVVFQDINFVVALTNNLK